MTRYSFTRRRHIKKYKKSRKGRRGRGGRSVRSIRRCKTRKPKGFRKAKRHTLGNRRRTGGVGCEGYKFNIDSNELASYMLKNGITQSMYLPQQLQLIGFGIAFVTNAKKGAIWKEYNRPECLAVFRVGYNIYIVRGKYPYDANVGMDGNIYGVLVVDYSKDTPITRLIEDLPKQGEIAATIKRLGCNGCTNFMSYTVKTTSDDKYRIAICSDTNHPFTPKFQYSRDNGQTTDSFDNINNLFEKLVNNGSTEATEATEATKAARLVFMNGLVTPEYPHTNK